MKDLLDMFYIQGGQHEIILYAITIDPKQPIRMSLSAEGKAAAQVAVLSDPVRAPGHRCIRTAGARNRLITATLTKVCPQYLVRAEV